ncbi:hypothetical protein D9619_003110 [Psilocybe cf. subviscida]|uniref:protein-tyrosine-phosphatase n=1 Tax=Psilocybe cf. subviscida TaxID=2480587 RepID=A0A8H5ETE4_9AGAR|nr:hypothetical protein D9619_003110 [Psilocybe cf. subviscida]
MDCSSSFADAVNARIPTLISLPPVPTTLTPSMPAPPASFPALTPTDLDAVWLYDPAVLIVDIRPHAAFSSARIPRAVSLSVPSTLLKRPMFSLQRLAAMLPSSASRTRFNAWPSASKILVYDADSIALSDSSNINGLLRKFKADGFTGDLRWLKGGFQAVWRENRAIVDAQPPSPEGEHDDDDPAVTAAAPSLRARQLPPAAFALSSTTAHATSFSSKRPQPGQPHPHSLPTPATNPHPAFNPFFDTIRQNTELSHGITERIPLRLPSRVRRRIRDLPFPWLQRIADKADSAPHGTSSSSESEDDFAYSDDKPDLHTIDEGKEELAMQFFKIELSEQRRLMGIMAHHSNETGSEQNAAPFPFSITAGVEKGAKNRYRHIWPFEHARVRLHQKQEADDDYVNASYIQPLGTKRRYIATQGPLPATFTDFWTLCWQQNVHVIVMLTREVEGAMVKCGSYWTDSVFGPLRLRLISTEGQPPPDDRPSPGFFAPHTSLAAHSSHPPHARRIPHTTGSHRQYRPHHYHQKRYETVKRVFELTHTGYPAAKPRRITHLQYLEWPDMNVPDDPRGVLGLIKQVDEAVVESQVDEQQPLKDRAPVDAIDAQTGIATHTLVNSPVLLHCSAGVGRTGGFIAVHAILDAIRREIRQTHDGVPDKEMQVDEPQDNIQGPTATLTMSNGPGAGSLVVHVPLVATPMQVDEDREPQITIASGPVSSGTQRWAENVHQQTGISAPLQAKDLQEPEAQAFPDSATSERDSSVESVVNSLQVSSTPNGSYHYPSSSSLGTSVSGTSSSSKATFPSSASSLAPGRRPSNASALLSSVLNHQQRQVLALSQQQRVRTVSAPATNVHFNLRLPQRAMRMSAQTMANTPEEIATSKLRTFQFESPAKRERRVSSDAEPPSDSQSPSADEASTTFLTSQQEHQHMSAPPPGLFNSMQTERAVSVSPPPPPPGQDSSPPAHQTHGKAFDYKEPRPLHENKTPPALTTYEDPVLEVVQDMREQRMSLCQSLRQYVFVHAAIIEGALMVVDEEKDAAAGISAPPLESFDGRQRSQSQSRGRDLHRPASALSMVSTTSTGKRASSPTELRKEDVGGDVMLAKRPSMKRKDRSGDEVGRATEDQARYHPVPARVSSSVMHSGAVSAPSVRSMPP